MHTFPRRLLSAILLLLVAGTLACGCTGSPDAQTGTVTISSNTTAYAPVMSQTVGIELAAHYSGPAQDAAYHWITDYGEFVAWASPDYEVTPLGADAVTQEPVVYWTYLPEQPGEEPATVRVAVTVEEAGTGRTLATAEQKIVRDGSLYRPAAE
ncbi:hypothetical protein FGU65_13805 [Methanoculleus sp. FWC-SCC1]|uniref:Uncharacterized protein n=1 Tax=Methanoculleus frigidifontis TaxID=2584085 RepID=A0ABT8MDC8_9EURY|nr:hypothetical protein [Methanoculleus sp. FWC-SCC1]MDN7025945.1 hypothetical protein [Methanoculleus sp. FWC-SCC1]